MPPNKKLMRQALEKEARELGVRPIMGEELSDLGARIDYARATSYYDDDAFEQDVKAINNALKVLRGVALTQPPEGRDHLLKLADKADSALERMTQDEDDG